MRSKVLKIYAWILAIGVPLAFLMYITGVTIPCRFHEVTGLNCPGCGITRMVFAALRFDFPTAFSHNPVMFVILCFWNVIGLCGIAEKPKWIQNPRFLFTCFWISFGVMIIFGVIRNIY